MSSDVWISFLELCSEKFRPSHTDIVRANEYLTASFWPETIHGVLGYKQSWVPNIDDVDMLVEVVEVAHAEARMTVNQVDVSP